MKIDQRMPPMISVKDHGLNAAYGASMNYLFNAINQVRGVIKAARTYAGKSKREDIQENVKRAEAYLEVLTSMQHNLSQLRMK